MPKRNRRPTKSLSQPHALNNERCGYCRKRTFASRKLARRTARILYPGERMSEFPCQGGGDGWHYGHHDQYARELTGPASVEGLTA
jgi:hypothetical protein